MRGWPPRTATARPAPAGTARTDLRREAGRMGRDRSGLVALSACLCLVAAGCGTRVSDARVREAAGIAGVQVVTEPPSPVAAAAPASPTLPPAGQPQATASAQPAPASLAPAAPAPRPQAAGSSGPPAPPPPPPAAAGPASGSPVVVG